MNVARTRAQLKVLKQALDAGFDPKVIQPQIDERETQLRDHVNSLRRRDAVTRGIRTRIAQLETEVSEADDPLARERLERELKDRRLQLDTRTRHLEGEAA